MCPVDTANDAGGTNQVFATFREIQADAGLREALAYLGQVTQFRFVAVVRFDGGRADVVVYHDRQNPELLTPAHWPAQVTAGCYARDTNGALTTIGELGLRSISVAQDEALACRCTPIIDPEGVVLATLCLFDDSVRNPVCVDLSLLLQVAASLVRYSPEGGAMPTATARD